MSSSIINTTETERLLNQAFAALHLPSTSFSEDFRSTTFRFLALRHVHAVLPPTRLLPLLDLAEVHEEAEFLARSFRRRYGQQLWGPWRSDDEIEKELLKPMETYFVSLLQLPAEDQSGDDDLVAMLSRGSSGLESAGMHVEGSRSRRDMRLEEAGEVSEVWSVLAEMALDGSDEEVLEEDEEAEGGDEEAEKSEEEEGQGSDAERTAENGFGDTAPDENFLVLYNCSIPQAGIGTAECGRVFHGAAELANHQLDEHGYTTVV